MLWQRKPHWIDLLDPMAGGIRRKPRKFLAMLSVIKESSSHASVLVSSSSVHGTSCVKMVSFQHEHPIQAYVLKVGCRYEPFSGQKYCNTNSQMISTENYFFRSNIEELLLYKRKKQRVRCKI